jgi:hypothetical protein
MTDHFTIQRIGLPDRILHALSPRPVPSEDEIGASRRQTDPAPAPTPAPAPGAVYAPTQQDPMLTELRMLAELHAAHQANGSSSNVA